MDIWTIFFHAKTVFSEVKVGKNNELGDFFALQGLSRLIVDGLALPLCSICKPNMSLADHCLHASEVVRPKTNYGGWENISQIATPG
jgi:hypothetical protein